MAASLHMSHQMLQPKSRYGFWAKGPGVELPPRATDLGATRRIYRTAQHGRIDSEG